MTLDRRRFVIGSLATGFAAACGSRKDPPPATPAAPATAPAPAAAAPPKKKSILILGGTGFLGPHVVEAALARGHTVTLFNRGKTRPELFPTVEKLQGDRDGKLDALRGRTWDAVVDTSAYVPRITKLSAELLAPSVGQYVNISTISVYAKHDRPGADETAPVATLDDPTTEDVKKHYGALKALCEAAAEAAMPGRVANLRPGLIIGPGDPTGRFTHWPWRMAQGGEVLCPGDGGTPVQYVDGRDLGAWIVKIVEDGTVGVFNALGPARRITMKEVLEACNAAGGNKATLTWVDAAFLEQHEVSPWGEMPMWFDPKGEMAGFGTMSNARAVAAGLTFRPILDTAKDTLAWLPTVPDDKREKLSSSGISRDKEAKVLAAWKARK
ncbi:MAG TPA: NAD-dependent epimerase/dehydratase family protein [Kofleriaceae bacterium]|nr:NAD-dependent epimerase/dehydratase family protein [Kofleriaceae bacterium]